MDYKLLNPPLSTPPQPPNVLTLYANENKVDKIMQPSHKQTINKQHGSLFKVAVFATILFILLSHHITYTVFNQIYAIFTKNNNFFITLDGCPSMNGILSNATIFFVLLLCVSYY
jgi:hypothetical protein